MNKYAAHARMHWSQVAPNRFRTIEDPEKFFSQLGEQVLSRVDELTVSLAGPDPEDEDYLAKVGRLKAAQLQAEEIALSELVFIEPELSTDQAREEWEATRAPDSALADWAWNLSEFPEQYPSTAELESIAQIWALPTSFLEELLASTNPTAFLAEHASTMAASADRRFLQQTTSQ